jgi:small subunit ribosomal protein S13e
VSPCPTPVCPVSEADFVSSRMILIESRIHRLARYYIKTQQLPPTFKYEAATASTLVA